MKTPEAYLRDLLGDLGLVTILDRETDLADVVAISGTEDLADLLREHPTRTMAWSRIRDKCAARLGKVKATYEEIRAQRFVSYYTVHEDQERKELEDCVYDEDMFLPEDRRKALADRMARGVKALGRWRRNFSDALIHSFVNSDAAVVDADIAVRQAQAQLNLAESIVKALDHRRWCLTHLVTLQRDIGR